MSQAIEVLRSKERGTDDSTAMALPLPDYQVRKRINDGRGAARLNMDGDLSVSFPKPSPSSTNTSSSNTASHPQVVSGSHADTRVTDKASPPGNQKHAVISCKDREAGLVDGHEVCDEEARGSAEQSAKSTDSAHYQHLHDEDEEEEEEGVSGIGADVAWKFLLAGGIAGAGTSIVEDILQQDAELTVSLRLRSFSYCHCAVRSTQGLSDHVHAHPRGNEGGQGSKGAGDHDEPTGRTLGQVR